MAKKRLSAAVTYIVLTLGCLIALAQWLNRRLSARKEDKP